MSWIPRILILKRMWRKLGSLFLEAGWEKYLSVDDLGLMGRGVWFWSGLDVDSEQEH